MLRKFGIIAVLALMAVALAAVPALAVTDFSNAPSGAHYRQGSAEPVCTIDETTNTVNCTESTIGGVGNTNATVELTVTADAFLTCTNRGGNLVEPHSTTVSDATTAVERPNRNGQIVLDAISEEITEGDVEAAFTCPNRNWTEDVQDITITGFTYSVTFAGFTEPAILVTGP
jgi:hypothetical protein